MSSPTALHSHTEFGGQENIDSLRQRLSEEVRLRRYTEEVLDKRQEELQLREANLLDLSHTLQRLKSELKSTQGQLDSAKVQIQSRSKQLNEVRDQVFRLQPTRSEITEAEAKSLYSSLCKGIQRWVENRMSSLDTAGGGARISTTAGALQAYRLVSLLRESARHCIDVDQSDEYHIFAVVMNYLWLALFSRPFYSPLDDSNDNSTQASIDKIEKAMSGQRDAEFCRHWRSDTLSTITTHPKFQTVRDRYLDVLSKDLASLLSLIALRSTQLELQKSIRKNIIEPAAELAHQLHLATPVFSLKWPVRHAWSRLEVYDCTNLADGGLPIDFSGTDTNSAARKNATYLFDLAPGLFVERIESGRKLGPKAIARPQVLTNVGPNRCVQSYTTIRSLWDIADPERPPSQASGPRK